MRKALQTTSPPLLTIAPPSPPGGILKPYHPQIDALIAKYPDLSAVRVLEEISRGPEGFCGSVYPVRRYLHKIRPDRGRVYQEVIYEPGEAMQVDWGDCGLLTFGQTTRRVSVFVAVLCFSRLCYIEFTLSQHKAEFYRALVNALMFYGGSPKKVIFDNLKAAVVNGSGRHACLHPEFAALCGYFCMEPIACESRDPESKGIVEGTVRYVKGSALAGRSEELVTWDAYRRLGPTWRDEVANVRLHATTHERPVDRIRARTSPPAPVAGGAIRHRRDSLRAGHIPCPGPLRRQPLLRAGGAGAEEGHASGQRHAIADYRRWARGGRASTLLRQRDRSSPIVTTDWRR